MATGARTGAITVAVIVSMAAVVWVSYRTIVEWQQSARRWFEKYFNAEAVTRRLLAFYEAL